MVEPFRKRGNYTAGPEDYAVFNLLMAMQLSKGSRASMTILGKLSALFVLATAGLLVSTMAAESNVIDRALDDRVHFFVPESWLMSERPRGFAFKIRNAGEDWHSNLPTLSIYDRDLRTARESYDFQEEATHNVRNFQQKELAGSWGCRTWLSKPFQTQIVTWDCRRIVGDFGVAVDVMWPHLAGSGPDYDAHMEEVLSNFLGSVSIR